MKLLSTCFVLIVAALPHCGAAEWSYGVWREPGDIMIGFITSAHRNNASQIVPYDARFACGDLVPAPALLVSQFRMQLRRINELVLPGVKLGFDIVDSCQLSEHTVYLSSQWSLVKVARFHRPSLPAPPVAVVGAFFSRIAAPTAVMLQQFEIPMIDYGATSADLSDRRRYPIFGRTVPSDKNQAAALAELASALGNDCVHIVYSSGLYGELGAKELRVQLAKQDVCVTSDQIAPAIEKGGTDEIFSNITNNILAAKGSNNTIVCFCEEVTHLTLMRAIASCSKTTTNMAKYQILASDTWGTSIDLDGVENVAEGAITVTVSSQSDDKLDPEMFTEMAKNMTEQDPFLEELVENKYGCTFGKVSAGKPKCNPEVFNLTSDDLPVSPYAGPMKRAVYAVVKGMQKLMAAECGADKVNSTDCIRAINQGQMSEKLYQSIVSTVHVENDTTIPLFDSNGDGPASYEFNWYSANNKPSSYVVVGSWNGEGTFKKTPAFGRI